MAPHERARLGIAYVPQGRDIFPLLTVQGESRDRLRAADARRAHDPRRRLRPLPGAAATCCAGAAATSPAASSSSSPSPARWSRGRSSSSSTSRPRASSRRSSRTSAAPSTGCATRAAWRSCWSSSISTSSTSSPTPSPSWTAARSCSAGTARRHGRRRRCARHLHGVVERRSSRRPVIRRHHRPRPRADLVGAHARLVEARADAEAGDAGLEVVGDVRLRRRRRPRAAESSFGRIAAIALMPSGPRMSAGKELQRVGAGGDRAERLGRGEHAGIGVEPGRLGRAGSPRRRGWARRSICPPAALTACDLGDGEHRAGADPRPAARLPPPSP